MNEEKYKNWLSIRLLGNNSSPCFANSCPSGGTFLLRNVEFTAQSAEVNQKHITSL